MATSSAQQLFEQSQKVETGTTTSPDVFRLTKRLTWRGIEYPVASRSVSFRHEQIEHVIQYRANDFPEPIGPHSFLFRYTIPMREGIARGPYKNLFNIGLTTLVRDLRNKEPGELYDPFYGSFRCVPVSFEETVDINRRDGTDVQVEFIHAPHILDGEPALLDNITGIQGLASDAGAFDKDVKAVDFQQTASPQGLTDALSAINGIQRQALRVKDRTVAKLEHITYQLRVIEDTIDEEENPQNWGLRDTARGIRDQTVRLTGRLQENPATKTKRLVTKSAQTIGAVALQAGMTVQELIEMNPALAAGGPLVKKGVEIKIRRPVGR